MTIARRDREENHRAAFELMMRVLGDRPIDTKIFDSENNPFADSILRTTWEELVRAGYVDALGSSQYRLTPKGWLVGVELSGAANSSAYKERLGRLLGVIKGHVKGRRDSKIVDLQQLAAESGEAEGWIFNVIDSRASSAIGSGRTGAGWYGNERGRLVEIPLDFNLEPVDIAAALTIPHLEKIQELEERIEEIEADRAQFLCPYCNAEISGIAGEDFPEHHAYVTYEHFGCGRVTADGFEEVPCPYGPNWPQLDEFDFVCEQHGSLWLCHPVPKTAKAWRTRTTVREMGQTREESLGRARQAVAPKVKG